MRLTDLHYVVSSLPRDIRDLLKENPGFCVAGGFIRSTFAQEDPADIDIFGPSPEKILEVAASLRAKRAMLQPMTRMHKTKNAVTITAPGRIPIQFILRWTYSAPNDVLASFDFTIAQAVVWYAGEKNGGYQGKVGDGFYQDLATKRLVYLEPKRDEDPGGSMMRMRKFLKKGYHISPESMAKVIVRLNQGVKYDEAKEEWKVIAGLLREVDPLRIVDGVDFVEEHK